MPARRTPGRCSGRMAARWTGWTPCCSRRSRGSTCGRRCCELTPVAFSTPARPPALDLTCRRKDLEDVEQMTEGRVLTVAFDALSSARWAPVFQVLWLERPDVHLRWLAAGFPDGRPSLLDGADVGLFVAPPDEDGLTALTIEESQMVVLLAVGHELAGRAELSVADIDGHALA